MKKLIIAEKPSLCRTIVSAIPEHAEKNRFTAAFRMLMTYISNGKLLYEE